MAQVNKIDSNVVGLSWAEESSIGTLPGSPTWYELEPNSFGDFGGDFTNTPRRPISDDRQRRKGPLTDLDADGGFNVDLTDTNLRDLLQGFFFADRSDKGVEAVTAVDEDAGNPDEYEVASTTGFLVNSLIVGQNFAEAANNALNVVTAVVADTSVEVATGQLTAEASPPSDAQIVVVGYQSAAGDVDVDVSGTWPKLTSTTLDFTTLGLSVGEWIFIGGDTSSTMYSNSENNGFKRIRSIAANAVELDKSATTMITEAHATKTVQLFFGRVLKNQTGSNIVRRSYNIERQLGAPDDASPAQIQSEYLEGAVPSELTINVPTADKVNMDMSFVATNYTTRDGATGVKSGTRVAAVQEDAFNTSSDVPRIKMHVVSTTDENPSALFAYVTALSVTINNNVDPTKAVGTLGAFDVSAGAFDVGGNVTAYFSNVSAVEAIRSNSDVSLDMAIVRDNVGLVLDLPLMSLGGGRLSVEQDRPIMLPVEMNAASGAQVDSDLDHTILICFFDYLPDAAG